MATPSLPSAKVIHVDTRGAVILSEESPEVSRLPVARQSTHGPEPYSRPETAEEYTYPTT